MPYVTDIITEPLNMSLLIKACKGDQMTFDDHTGTWKFKILRECMPNIAALDRLGVRVTRVVKDYCYAEWDGRNTAGKLAPVVTMALEDRMTSVSSSRSSSRGRDAWGGSQGPVKKPVMKRGGASKAPVLKASGSGSSSGSSSGSAPGSFAGLNEYWIKDGQATQKGHPVKPSAMLRDLLEDGLCNGSGALKLPSGCYLKEGTGLSFGLKQRVGAGGRLLRSVDVIHDHQLVRYSGGASGTGKGRASSGGARGAARGKGRAASGKGRQVGQKTKTKTQGRARGGGARGGMGMGGMGGMNMDDMMMDPLNHPDMRRALMASMMAQQLMGMRMGL
jgi:hypothetical protein